MVFTSLEQYTSFLHGFIATPFLISNALIFTAISILLWGKAKNHKITQFSKGILWLTLISSSINAINAILLMINPVWNSPAFMNLTIIMTYGVFFLFFILQLAWKKEVSLTARYLIILGYIFFLVLASCVGTILFFENSTFMGRNLGLGFSQPMLGNPPPYSTY